MSINTRMPIKYNGGKWRIADWVISSFPPHRVYVEPFCGSASVFFRKRPAYIEVINDLDGDVINFFDVLRTREDELIRAIELTPYARAEYERSLQRDQDDDPLERARRFYIAMWQGYRSARFENTGWKKCVMADTGYPYTRLWKRTDHLHQAAQRLRDAQIENKPALEVIKTYDQPGGLIYVDPPYVMNTRVKKSLYNHEMDDSDHRELLDTLKSAESAVIISGYDSELYRDALGGWDTLSIETNTRGHKIGRELLWLSPNVKRVKQLSLFD